MAYELNSVYLKEGKIVLKGRQFDGIERDYNRMEISNPDTAEHFGKELIALAEQWKADLKKAKVSTLDNLRKQRIELDAKIKKLTEEYDEEAKSLGPKAT